MSHQNQATEILDSLSIGSGDAGRTSRLDEIRSGASRGEFVRQTAPIFEQALSSEEATALLNIHPKTLQRLARIGEIPGFRIGRMWGFRASALNRWLENKTSS